MAVSLGLYARLVHEVQGSYPVGQEGCRYSAGGIASCMILAHPWLYLAIMWIETRDLEMVRAEPAT